MSNKNYDGYCAHENDLQVYCEQCDENENPYDYAIASPTYPELELEKCDHIDGLLKNWNGLYQVIYESDTTVPPLDKVFKFCPECGVKLI